MKISSHHKIKLYNNQVSRFNDFKLNAATTATVIENSMNNIPSSNINTSKSSHSIDSTFARINGYPIFQSLFDIKKQALVSYHNQLSEEEVSIEKSNGGYPNSSLRDGIYMYLLDVLEGEGR